LDGIDLEEMVENDEEHSSGAEKNCETVELVVGDHLE
jgi:hypothetical protein